MQKILLSCIPKNFDENPITCDDFSTLNTPKDTKEYQFERAILLSKETTVFYDYNIFRSVANFESAAQNLEAIGIGKLGKQKKEKSTKSSNCFIKTNYYELDEDEQLKLMNSLMKFQVSLSIYTKSFPMKRCNSNSIISDGKKIIAECDSNSESNH